MKHLLFVSLSVGGAGIKSPQSATLATKDI